MSNDDIRTAGYRLTVGQYVSISPDFRKATDTTLYVRDVDPDTLETTWVAVEIVSEPEYVTPPRHYAGLWPLDPRD
jgi:hypothetical protein